MKSLRAALCFLGLLLALPANAAPRNIILSDSLLAHADKWSVKHGAEWLGKSTWRFGSYAVAARQGWTTGSTDTNLFKTKTESQILRKFSMVATNTTTDSAFLRAAHEITTKTNPGFKVGHGVTVGGDGGRVVEADRFLASITLNQDTTEWALAIVAADVSDRHDDPIEGEASYRATLSSGDRLIVITPVFSRKFDKRPSFGAMLMLSVNPPAMGFEFAEDGRALCAVEYFSAGFGGSHKNTVWMDRNLEPRLQLVLAAAMTALLQKETAALNAPAEPERP